MIGATSINNAQIVYVVAQILYPHYNIAFGRTNNTEFANHDNSQWNLNKRRLETCHIKFVSLLQHIPYITVYWLMLYIFNHKWFANPLWNRTFLFRFPSGLKTLALSNILEIHFIPFVNKITHAQTLEIIWYSSSSSPNQNLFSQKLSTCILYFTSTVRREKIWSGYFWQIRTWYSLS